MCLQLIRTFSSEMEKSTFPMFLFCILHLTKNCKQKNLKLLKSFVRVVWLVVQKDQAFAIIEKTTHSFNKGNAMHMRKKQLTNTLFQVFQIGMKEKLFFHFKIMKTSIAVLPLWKFILSFTSHWPQHNCKDFWTHDV